MSYILDSTTIKAPHDIAESNNTQMAQQRTLKGTIGRDYFGDNKRTWEFRYNVITKTDFDTIKAIYDDYLTDGTPKTFQSTETNYTIAQTTVHVDIPKRDFPYRGDGYISSFVLILTEA